MLGFVAAGVALLICCLFLSTSFLSTGGSWEALELVMPFLEKVTAKDNQGRPCVKPLGPGGCGHYVRMIHDDIEQGMVSMLCEV
jgi:6-phosphogluconate dehydrogenase